jgi:opacity protein-like surface antigen
MKPYRLVVLASVALLLAPALFAADFGVRAGRYDEGDTEFVGAELAFDLGVVTVNPNVEYLLEDDTTAGTANVDLTYDVINIGTVTPFVGAGLGLSYFDTDALGSEMDVVGNLIGGVSVQLDFLTPYAQVKYVRSFENEDDGDDDDLALVIGLRF